jgi:glutaredoxin 3
VKEYLSQKGVTFTEYDVSRDEARAKEMMEKAHQMVVPVVAVDGKVIIGFNTKELDAALSGSAGESGK